MPRTFTVTPTVGIYVRSQPNAENSKNILRYLPCGTVFTAHDVFTVGIRTWARLTPPEAEKPEYVLVVLKGFPQLTTETTEQPPESALYAWVKQLDAWARERGYNGVAPL